MYVLFDLFLLYQMGVIYGSLWGVLSSNPYITPVTYLRCGGPPCWGLSGFHDDVYDETFIIDILN